MGALSKLDEFLLNPQVRTCSVAAHGTSRSSNAENRETHGDRSSDDPYPEVGYFPHHSGQLNSPEAETISHTVTETYPHSSFQVLSEEAGTRRAAGKTLQCLLIKHTDTSYNAFRHIQAPFLLSLRYGRKLDGETRKQGELYIRDDDVQSMDQLVLLFGRATSSSRSVD